MSKKKVLFYFCYIFLISFVKSQDCVVTFNGVLQDPWPQFPVSGNNIQDNAAPYTVVDTFEISNVLSAVIENYGTGVSQPYVDLNFSTTYMELFIKDNFVSYEQSEVEDRLEQKITFNCADGTPTELYTINEIIFSNTFEPQFENQNDPGIGYTYKLPVPFPKGVSISAAYNDIIAFDADIGNTNIIFSLEGDDSAQFEVVLDRIDSTSFKKPRYYVDLFAKDQLIFTETLQFTIKATDVDSTGSNKFSTAIITIETDPENSEDPVVRPGVFNSPLFITNIDKNMLQDTVLVSEPTEIQLTGNINGTVEVTVVESDGITLSDLITATYATDTKIITLKLLRDVAINDFTEEGKGQILRAIIQNQVNAAETSILVNFVNEVIGEFTSTLYTANIDNINQEINVPLPTLPGAIQFSGAPLDGIFSVPILEKPYDGAPWEDGQFIAVQDSTDKSIIHVQLNKSLTTELINTYSSISAVLKITESTTWYSAETLVEFTLPKPTVDPDEIFLFESSIYTSEIDPLSPIDTVLITIPETILLTGTNIGTITTKVLDTDNVESTLVTSQFDQDTKITVLKLLRALSSEESQKEGIGLKLQASSSGYTTETAILVNIKNPNPSSQDSFNNNYFTATIATLDQPINVDLPTNPVEIKLNNPPTTGTLVLAIIIPYAGANWIEDQFTAVDKGNGVITVQLKKLLSIDDARKYDSITGILRVTEETSGYNAETVVEFILPVIENSFSQSVYSTIIKESDAVGTIVSTNEEILLAGDLGGTELTKVIDQNGVESTLMSSTLTNNKITLALIRVLSAQELNLEGFSSTIQVIIDSETTISTALLIDVEKTDFVQESDFASPLYTATIDSIDQNINVDLPTNPNEIKINNAPDNAIDVILIAPYSEAAWEEGLFKAVYQGNGIVTVQLATKLTEEILLKYRSITAMLKATQDTTFAAETLVEFKLPEPATANMMVFDYGYYTSFIDSEMTQGSLTITPSDIKLNQFSVGSTTCSLSAAHNSYFSSDMFSVTGPDENGIVKLNLDRALTTQELQLESLSVKITASDSAEDATAETYVNINVPEIANQSPPIVGFQNILYTADITDPEMVPGPLTTSPGDITIINYEDGIQVSISKPATGDYVEGQFSITQNNEKVTLNLAQTLLPETLELEVVFIQLDAKLGEAIVSSTIIQIDIPTTSATIPDPKPEFELSYYTGKLTQTNSEGDLINTHTAIKVNNLPSTEPTVTSVIAAPGVDDRSEYYRAQFVDNTDQVQLFLAKSVDEAGLNTEVHVVTIRVSTATNIVFETLVQIDMPTIVIPEPGDPGTFTSVIYVATVDDPMVTGVIETHIPMQINEPKPTDLVYTLMAVPNTSELPPPFIENFAVTPDANNELKLSIITVLPSEAFENEYLVMTLQATSASDPNYKGETVIHVKLPDVICPTTTPVQCATCPPCLCTTTVAPPTGFITFDQNMYTYDGIGGEVPPVGPIFTVKAKYNDTDVAFTYGIIADDYLSSKLEIDAVTGEVTLIAALPPGSFYFKVSAMYNDETNTNPAVIYMQAATICDDTIYFPYHLVSKNVNEATDQEILPDNQINGAITCTYSQKINPTIAESWFNFNNNTGSLSITSLSDVDILDDNQVYVKIIAECTPITPSLLEQYETKMNANVTLLRNEMMVVIQLQNINDITPEFPYNSYLIGYPTYELANQILPENIIAITATDGDKNDKLTYSLGENDSRYQVHADTGALYPISGIYNYEDDDTIVRVFDSNNQHNDAITYQIKIIEEDEIAVIRIDNALIENVDEIMTTLNNALPSYKWRYFKSSVIANPPPAKSKAINSPESLFLIIYAFNDKNKAISYDDIKDELDNLASNAWKISKIQTWEEAGFISNLSYDSFRAATIALGVITGLLIILIILIIYLLVIRKKQKKNAHSGFKNTAISASAPVATAHTHNYENNKRSSPRNSYNSSNSDEIENTISVVDTSKEAAIQHEEVRL